MEINGAAALISGGASGLGEATARILAAAGATVALAAAGATVVLADLNAERGKALADELKGVFVETNVADEESVANAVAAPTDTGLPLRMGISCAGIGWASRIIGKDGSPHDLGIYKKVIEVNQIGTFNVMRHAASAISKTEPLGDDGE